MHALFLCQGMHTDTPVCLLCCYANTNIHVYTSETQAFPQVFREAFSYVLLHVLAHTAGNVVWETAQPTFGRILYSVEQG